MSPLGRKRSFKKLEYLASWLTEPRATDLHCCIYWYGLNSATSFTPNLSLPSQQEVKLRVSESQTLGLVQGIHKRCLVFKVAVV